MINYEKQTFSDGNILYAENLNHIENFLEVIKNNINELNSTGGLAGKSAYEIAVENGFIGTEAEWLESLKGTTPLKGTDYFTSADKTEMVNAVIEALPKYAGEVV